MTWATFAIGAGGLFLSCLGFLFGRIYSQTDNILEKKRNAYAEFLRMCPAPNEAHLEDFMLSNSMQREMGVLTMYASRDVTEFAAQYFACFADAQMVLVDTEIAGHPEFMKLMTSYNKMVWAMRTDGLSHSIFATPKSRIEYNPNKWRK